MSTGNYMTFYFDAASLKNLVNLNPDYVLVNVGYKLIADTTTPTNQSAAMTVNAVAYKNGNETPLGKWYWLPCATM